MAVAAGAVAGALVALGEPVDRLAQVRALIAANHSIGDRPHDLAQWMKRTCLVAAEVLPAAGIGISMMTAEGLRGTVAASDPVSGWLEELQFILGEGPCVDAFASRRPVLESDLKAASSHRWPAYGPAAAKEVRAVFAFPIQVGAARLGVLDVYRREPGPLSRVALSRAMAFAQVVLETLLDGQSGHSRGDEDVGPKLDLDVDYTLYQAQGMVTVDLGVSLAEAMSRLRAHAYLSELPLWQIAADILAGRLRLERDRC